MLREYGHVVDYNVEMADPKNGAVLFDVVLRCFDDDSVRDREREIFKKLVKEVRGGPYTFPV